MTNENHQSAKTPLCCAVIGVGRMGHHHARVYHDLPQAQLVAVVDGDIERVEEVASEFGVSSYTNVEELLNAHSDLDAVSIVVPTIHHYEASRPFLEKQIACLIEKPLAPGITEAKRIVDLADQTGTILQVGHIERYNPTIRALKNHDPIEPRFIEVHRVSPLTFRSVDVGVVLDMMIHDLDVLLMLTGCEPTEVQACGVAVVGEAEDVCNARLVFPSGCVANVTASRLAMKTERKIRIIAEDAYASIDFAKKSGVVIRRTANEEALAEVRAHLAAGDDLSDLDYTDFIHIDTLEIDDQDQLELEISEFLHSAATGEAPAVDARAGFAAVRTAERIVSAARAHAKEIGAATMSIVQPSP